MAGRKGKGRREGGVREENGRREGGGREGISGICSSDWSVALQDPLLDMEDVEEDFVREDVFFLACFGFLNLETISWTSMAKLLNTLPLTMLFY